MKNKSTFFNDNILCAIESAVKASEIIMKHYYIDIEIKHKSDNSPVTNADLASSNYIKNSLSKFDIPIIDEESKILDFNIRKKWKKVWCIDPLDGTKEFIAKNDNFSVNIALIEDNKPIFGIISNPVENTVLFGGINFGLFEVSFENYMNQDSWEKINFQSKQPEKWSFAISKSHQSDKDLKLLEFLKIKIGQDIEVNKKGSALKFIDMIKNETHLYPRFAPTMEWDTAAGQAILEAIGGKILDYKTGLPLSYNKESLYNPYFVAFHPTFIKSNGTFILNENNVFI